MIEEHTLLKKIKKYLRSEIRKESREIKTREIINNVSSYSTGFSNGVIALAENTLEYIKEEENFSKLHKLI